MSRPYSAFLPLIGLALTMSLPMPRPNQSRIWHQERPFTMIGWTASCAHDFPSPSYENKVCFPEAVALPEATYVMSLMMSQFLCNKNCLNHLSHYGVLWCHNCVTRIQTSRPLRDPKLWWCCITCDIIYDIMECCHVRSQCCVHTEGHVCK